MLEIVVPHGIIKKTLFRAKSAAQISDFSKSMKISLSQKYELIELICYIAGHLGQFYATNEYLCPRSNCFNLFTVVGVTWLTWERPPSLTDSDSAKFRSTGTLLTKLSISWFPTTLHSSTFYQQFLFTQNTRNSENPTQ